MFTVLVSHSCRNRINTSPSNFCGPAINLLCDQFNDIESAQVCMHLKMYMHNAEHVSKNNPMKNTYCMTLWHVS